MPRLVSKSVFLPQLPTCWFLRHMLTNPGLLFIFEGNDTSNPAFIDSQIYQLTSIYQVHAIIVTKSQYTEFSILTWVINFLVLVRGKGVIINFFTQNGHQVYLSDSIWDRNSDIFLDIVEGLFIITFFQSLI